MKICILCPFEKADQRAIVCFTNVSKGHNHPAYPRCKPLKDAKYRYKTAIRAQGVTGTTVSKVDKAESICQIFGGAVPGAADPGLADA